MPDARGGTPRCGVAPPAPGAACVSAQLPRQGWLSPWRRGPDHLDHERVLRVPEVREALATSARPASGGLRRPAAPGMIDTRPTCFPCTSTRRAPGAEVRTRY